MSNRSTSRIYNTETLEAWFAQIGFDWEQCFDSSALSAGRQLYREGKISEVALELGEAVIYCKFDRKDSCYSVITLAKEGLNIRSSREDKAIGNAVAVGGLYEIEELLADEITPLLPEANDSDETSEPTTDSEAEESEIITANDREDRSLELYLEGIRRGLLLRACWSDNSGNKVNAFGEDAPITTITEREQLVKLTGFTREVGFRYEGETNAFVLKSVEKISPFFKYTLKRWEKTFPVLHMDYEATQLSKGPRKIQIEATTESVANDRIRISYQGTVADQSGSAFDLELLEGREAGLHLLPGLGLVEIEAEQVKTVAEIKQSPSYQKAGEATLPQYMVFSLLYRNQLNLRLSATIEEWRKRLSDEPNLGTDLDTMSPLLRDYQVAGVRWLRNVVRLGCHPLLADEMGLGKTLQILTLLEIYRAPNRPSLIVCPASVIPVWKNEARRWYPNIKTEILSSHQNFASESSDVSTVWVASYTQLRRHKHLLQDRSFEYAILDEAQSIKNPDAKISKACFSIVADHRVAMTGTPVENRVLDLWSVFRFLMPGLLGNRKQIVQGAERTSEKERAQFIEQLRSQIRPFVLRRLKREVSKELPKKQDCSLLCPITDAQRGYYNRTAAAVIGELSKAAIGESAKSRTHLFAALTRLRQICCDPGLVDNTPLSIERSGKLQVLVEKLEDAFASDPKRKVVLFSQFVRLLDRVGPYLSERFPKVKQYKLTGRTRNRARPVEGFQGETAPAMMLVSLKAGGTGITLHAADYVFILDPWWNPAAEEQAVDRVHRIGQTRPVTIYRMVTEATIEARIEGLKKEKRALFQSAFQEVEGSADLKKQLLDLKELGRLITG